MDRDPIVEEVRMVREAHAAKFHFDLKAIYEDLKRQEQENRERAVAREPRPVTVPASTP